MKAGLVAKKVGMSSFMAEDGARIPVTLLKIEGCKVIDQRTEGKHGYNALVVGYGEADVNKMKKPLKGHFAKHKIEAKKSQKEFRVNKEAFLDVGTELKADLFKDGQYVSVGKGFAGAMKRHNFGGLRASHGVSVSHRSHGSTGGCQDPGRVFKNKKMAGHMGNERVTVQNLEVCKVLVEDNILVIKGAVPGHKGAIVTVTEAVKKGS